MPRLNKRRWPVLKGRHARIWISTLLGMVVSVALVWWWRYAHQPTWRGKTVATLFAEFRVACSVHVTNLVLSGRSYQVEHVSALFEDQASEGLRALGPYAERWLGKEVQRGDGFLVRNYQRRYPKLPAAVRLHLPTPSSRVTTQADAAMALAAMGTNAPAVLSTVVKALASISSPAAYHFLKPLQKLRLKEGDLDPVLDEWTRNKASLVTASLFIDSLRLRTAATARFLTNALLSPLATERRQAWSMLASLKGHPEVIVPALTQVILAGDPAARSQAAGLLPDFRERSDLAIPSLLQGARLGNLDCIHGLRYLPVDPGDLNQLLNELIECGQNRLAATVAAEFKMQTPAAIRALTNSLSSASKLEREIALAGVYRLSNQAERVLPALQLMLNHPELEMRSQSIHILQQWGSCAAPALPDLIKALKDEDANFRYNVVYALQSLGTNALPALPELKQATFDQNELVRAAARRALDALGQICYGPKPGASASK